MLHQYTTLSELDTSRCVTGPDIPYRNDSRSIGHFKCGDLVKLKKNRKSIKSAHARRRFSHPRVSTATVVVTNKRLKPKRQNLETIKNNVSSQVKKKNITRERTERKTPVYFTPIKKTSLAGTNTVMWMGGKRTKNKWKSIPEHKTTVWLLLSLCNTYFFFFNIHDRINNEIHPSHYVIKPSFLTSLKWRKSEGNVR